MAMPRAARAPAASCAASAAMAAKASPQVVMASANATEPATGRPSTTSTTTSSTASTTLAASATSRAAVSGASRPTTAEPTRLLVGPGVPDHDEDAHQRGEDGRPYPVPPGAHRAEGVAPQAAVQEHQ